MSIPGVLKAQSADIEHALYEAERLSRVVASEKNPRWLSRLLLLKFAYLARACELACVPLAQHLCQSSNGDTALWWITYRPEAISNSSRSHPEALIFIGPIDQLTETQARSRAIGW